MNNNRNLLLYFTVSFIYMQAFGANSSEPDACVQEPLSPQYIDLLAARADHVIQLKTPAPLLDDLYKLIQLPNLALQDIQPLCAIIMKEFRALDSYGDGLSEAFDAYCLDKYEEEKEKNSVIDNLLENLLQQTREEFEHTSYDDHLRLTNPSLRYDGIKESENTKKNSESWCVIL